MSGVGEITLNFSERISRVNRRQPDALIELSRTVYEASHAIDALQLALQQPFERAKLQRVVIEHQKHCATLWNIYLDARQKWRTKGRDLHMVANIVQGTWVVLVRYLFVGRLMHDALDDPATLGDSVLQVEKWTRDMALQASRFGFVESCKHVLNITVSEKPIGAYTPILLIQALTMFIDAVDRVGWSPSASIYMLALFCRYGLMLHSPLTEAQGFGGIYAAVSEEEKTMLFNYKVPLKDDYFTATHCMFFHLFYRHRALHGLLDQTTLFDSPLNIVAVREWHAWRTAHGFAALEKACSRVFMGGEINEQVADRYWEMVMTRFVYPGELEFYQIMHPTDDGTDATRLLFNVRPATYRLLQEYLNKTAVEVIQEHAALNREQDRLEKSDYGDFTVGAFINSSVSTTVRHWALDRLVLLAFEVAFDMDCTMARLNPMFTQHAYVDDCSLSYERALPPMNTMVVENFRTMMPREQQEARLPFFIACWRLYIVIDGDNRVVFYSVHLLDALAAWLRLLFTNTNLKLDTLRQTWGGICANAPALSVRYDVAGR